MALSPADIDSFIAALHEDPALRDRVRAALLSDEFLAVPQSLRELDERMARAHAEHVSRMDALDKRIRELDERLTGRLDEMAKQMSHLSGRVGNLEGWQYELRYTHNLMAHLAPRFRRARCIEPSDLDAVEEAYQEGRISDDEWVDLHLLDVLAKGTSLKAKTELILAIELSVTVDESDVARAKRRSDILRRIGVEAEPAVDGQRIIAAARVLAEDLGVSVLVRDPKPA